MRITSKSEFKDKINMALQLQPLIVSKKATKQQEDTFLVLMNEIKEFKKSFTKN